MKKIYTYLLALFAMTTIVSCNDDKDEPQPIEPIAEPTIAWESNPNFEKQDITEKMDVKINIVAPAGIKTFKVAVESDVLNGKGIKEIDLIEPDENIKPFMDLILGNAGSPKDKTSYSLDVSNLVPKINTLTKEESDHKFTVTIVDMIDQSAAKTAVFHRVVTFNGTIVETAGAYYPGDQWGIGSDNILLTLLTGDAYTYRVEGNYGASYRLVGEGTALWLDLNAPANSGEKIPAGTYKALTEEPGEGESQDFTFLPGTDMGDWGITGSFIYTLETGASEPTYTMIDDGIVTVDVTNDIYTVLAEVKVGEASYEYKFEGVITDAKNNPPIGGGSGEYGEVVLDNLTYGEMDYYGAAYGETGTDYANWMIYLATDAYTQNRQGPVVQLEINTASSAKEAITPGKYTVFEGDFDASSFAPFSAVPGFTQESTEEGYYDYYGTWYYDDQLTPTYGATAGVINIEESDSGYKVTFEFTDDEWGGKVSGSYEGPLYYYDGTADSGSAPASINLNTRSSRKTTSVKTIPAGRKLNRPAFRR